MSVFAVTCGGCGRAYRLPVEKLADRAICQMCGGLLAITPEIRAAVDAYDQQRYGATGRPFPADCPICSRAVEAMPNATVTCKFCGTDYRSAGPGQGSLPVGTAAVARAARAQFRCGKCGAAAQAQVMGANPQAPCAACGAPTALASIPLEDLVAFPGDPELHGDPILSISVEALKTRWRRGEIGLDEAETIVDWLFKVMGQGRIVPLPPEPAADLFQYAILRASGAVSQKYGDGRVDLMVPTGDESGAEKAVTEGAALAGVALAAGLLGAIVWRRAKGGEGGATGSKPWIRFSFLPAAGGCTWAVAVQKGPNEFRPLTAEEAGEIFAKIGATVAPLSRKFVCFRALFGAGLSSRTMTMLAPRALEARLRALDPDLGDAAARVAQGFLRYA